jgi:hypothetical protein
MDRDCSSRDSFDTPQLPGFPEKVNNIPDPEKVSLLYFDRLAGFLVLEYCECSLISSRSFCVSPGISFPLCPLPLASCGILLSLRDRAILLSLVW